MYVTPFNRWNGKGLDKPDRTAWEIMLSKNNSDFYLTIPNHWQSVTKKQIAVVWPRATVKEAVDPLDINPLVVGKLELKNHFMFAIKTDMRTLGVLPSLMEVTKMLGDNDKIAIQILFDPAAPDWWHDAINAYESFTAGKMPSRLQLSPKAIGMAGAKAAAWVTMEALSVVTELLTSEPQKPVNIDGVDKAAALREKPIGRNVADKLKGEAIDVSIRIAIQSDDEKTAQNLLRSVWYSFRCLDGDNSFILSSSNELKTWRKMLSRDPGFKINSDYLSIKECSMLMQLPTHELQKEYKINAVEYRETNLPKSVTNGGIHIGNVTFRGHKQDVYLPINDHDELCLPHIVIGGMGTGKTKGFGANLAVEAVRNGMGAVIIDPAKGELGNEIESVLPPDKVVRIRFGKKPYTLDWREVLHSDRGRNRLANELIAFCEAASDEAGAQTVRYMRAAAKAVPTGRLSEVVSLLTDSEYRKTLIPTMRPQERQVWQDFSKLTEGRQMQIGMPILNRLDVIMGDDYLSECMDAPTGIDFVELLKEPKAIILDIPKGELGVEGVDVLASLVATKLDVAMVLRSTTFPVFVVQDEPHQYQKSARTWKAAAVESRKWRFAYVWMFHSWEQIPRSVGEIIKSAGAHYHLYTTSKTTYRELGEEIKPFDIEEAMKTPRHWAINVIRANGVTVEPFIAHMTPPPSIRKRRV